MYHRSIPEATHVTPTWLLQSAYRNERLANHLQRQQILMTAMSFPRNENPIHTPLKLSPDPINSPWFQTRTRLTLATQHLKDTHHANFTLTQTWSGFQHIQLMAKQMPLFFHFQFNNAGLSAHGQQLPH